MSSPTAQRWMVATMHPLAVDAALDVLEGGGGAADACVAAAAVLTIVDPRSTGIGGDAFSIYWSDDMDAPLGMAAAGPAPAGLSVPALRARGFDSMPQSGPWTITVPGSVAGWAHLIERFGRFDLARAIAPAVDIAESGFEVTPTIAREWADWKGTLEPYDYSASVYLPSGGPPAVGQRFDNPDLAGALRAIAEQGPKVFYEGWIADRIAAAVEAAGGPLRASDLAAWPGPRWVQPLKTRFRDLDVFEMPPPNQGVVALQALALYRGLEVSDPVDEDHALIECLKLAVADGNAHIADPDVHEVPVDALLSEAYLGPRRAAVDMRRSALAEAGAPSDTVYVAVMREGEACSFIHSVYGGFGSGVGAEGTGMVLQNRGAGFVLEDGHPNRPEPGKRPYHTILPAMLGRDGKPWGALGVVGGFMQPQGQVQVLRGILDRGLDPQSAVARPRFRVVGGRRVAFEKEFDPKIVAELRGRGHEPEPLSTFEAGGAQIVLRAEGGFVGGSDPRKDGVAKGA